jgi:cyclase
MLAKRIIPCLDVKDGRTVKGTNFLDLKDAGDPVELAVRYCAEGADELVFLDISATNEKRRTLTDLVKRVAANIDIPFTVGGGVSSVADIDALLRSGADKVSINTAAVRKPQLITDAASNFGSQCIVVAIDAKRSEDGCYVYLNGGREGSSLRVNAWALECVERGAGELLLTSMDADGTRDGFDIPLTREISHLVNIPVIASGGAGSVRDFEQVLTGGKADAALAAGVFHFGVIPIPDLKRKLRSYGIEIRV